ncbi:putative uncharacterized protein MYH16 isoform X2 [Mya arenaria]|uniref:putative uncharacterized protein MYH16 isoform X2 n=1 Tax=Mya arenaria TaxID=6604 RepID=UPI0022E52BE0|nr:putative uncharacterized protein MYH16 isoform X2 [Mya arenaria]
MPFCGLKKSKKEKRDPSPPFERKQPPDNSHELESLHRKIAEFEKENGSLQKELKNKDRELSSLRREAKDLKSKVDALKEEAKEAKSARDEGLVKKEEDVRVTSQISKDIREVERKMGDLDLQINVQHKPKGDNESEKSKLEERLRKAEQELEAVKKVKDANRKEANESLEKLRQELEALHKTLETAKTEKHKAEEDRDRLKKDKDSLEQKLNFTSKELEIARKESHIPRSPTRAPSDEWKAKIENAETELNKERQLRQAKERENSRLISDKDLLNQENGALVKEMDALKHQKDEEANRQKEGCRNEVNKIQEQVENYKAKLARAEEEKDKLLTRLSSVTAARVLDGNPNIADLSDPQRPQKIGEQLSQVYDDQWTDASENLEKLEMEEEKILKTLLDLLVTIYKHCQEAAENQQGRIDEDLFLPPMEAPPSPDTNGTDGLRSPTGSKHSMSKIPRFSSHKSSRPTLPNLSTEKKKVLKGEKLPEVPVEVRQGIKEYRKKVAKQVWPVIEKEVLNKLRRSDEFGDRIVDACKTYITKCVELCWLMRIQDPPVTIHWAAPEDGAFNSDVYRAYTKTGNRVEYVVWPAVYLHKGGPILMKGVAQGASEKN